MATKRTSKDIYDVGSEFLVGVVLITLSICATGQAQTAEQTALARSLFHRGIELYDNGEWQQASDHLRRSLALRQSPVAAYNLALSLQPQQRLIEASELLRQIVRDEQADAQLREASKEILHRIVPKIGALTVRIEGDATGVSFALDSKPLPREAIGVEVPIDPGSHLLAAIRNNDEIASLQETIEEGQKREMLLTLPPKPAVQPLDLSPRKASETKRKQAAKGGTGRYFREIRDEEAVDSIFTSGWFWVAAAVVVGAVVTISLVADSGN
ncbi:MAG: hypothetical protein JXA30_09995 [Deltaproteobacteria bacterium]|nr:hypothetical protein [Deltaproteobacteria bacterium]